MCSSFESRPVADCSGRERRVDCCSRRARGGCCSRRPFGRSSRAAKFYNSQTDWSGCVACDRCQRRALYRIAQPFAGPIAAWRDTRSGDFNHRRDHPSHGHELVFHKYYWTGWNARLRDLSKAAQKPRAPFFESLALVGVGLQSLILEAGMRPVLVGLAIGGALIAALGFVVFLVGAKLPYRKMLVFTGVLVVFVLFTFMGSTVRLFQTVGWLPVHPVPGLELPACGSLARALSDLGGDPHSLRDICLRGRNVVLRKILCEAR